MVALSQHTHLLFMHEILPYQLFTCHDLHSIHTFSTASCVFHFIYHKWLHLPRYFRFQLFIYWYRYLCLPGPSFTVCICQNHMAAPISVQSSYQSNEWPCVYLPLYPLSLPVALHIPLCVQNPSARSRQKISRAT